MALLGAAVLTASVLPQQTSAFVVGGAPSLARLSATRSSHSSSTVTPRYEWSITTSWARDGRGGGEGGNGVRHVRSAASCEAQGWRAGGFVHG